MQQCLATQLASLLRLFAIKHARMQIYVHIYQRKIETESEILQDKVEKYRIKLTAVCIIGLESNLL